MRCPKHPAIWLYENMMETNGFCIICQKWYDLKKLKRDEVSE